MDYVVYGTGYGATLLLLGYAVRTWGPGWRFRDDEESGYERREFRSARSAWERFTAGLGAVIATGGAALVLLTFILMAINPGDGIGSVVALAMTGLLLVGVAVWAWLFFSRFGAWGIVATPNALMSYEPAHYDSRTTSASPMLAQSRSQSTGDDEPDELAYDEDEFSPDEPEVADDDDADFAARFSKYELHHPGGEEEADEVPVTDGEGRFEAQYSKYESHHPDEDSLHEQEGDDRADAIDEYVETLTPEEVSEDIVDAPDVEPASEEGADAPIETYEDLVGPVDTPGEASDDDPLEVLPEAHGDIKPVLAAEPLPASETPESASGREDALRRLRERRAQRARQRPNDA